MVCHLKGDHVYKPAFRVPKRLAFDSCSWMVSMNESINFVSLEYQRIHESILSVLA